jgi:hypothetical protein
MIRRTPYSLVAAAIAVAGGLAFAQPAQADFRVNTTQSGTQINSDVAVNPTDGSFVVAWQSDSGNGYDIYLQRYDSLGNAVGDEVLVNNDNTSGRQSRPSVAIDATGDVVVVWESDNGDGDSFGIFGQRYNSAGAEVGQNFQVNTTTTGLQTAPDVAMDDAGNFVVVYEDTSSGGEGNYNLRARSYTAVGTGGTEVLINSEAGNQQLPDVSVNDAGTQAVVVYRDDAQDGSGYGVAGLTFSPNFGGTPTGISAEFTANQTTAGNQDEPAVDMDADGDFVVAWHSGSEGSRDVYARRYNASATPLSNEFTVGSTTGDQYLSDVAVADGASGPFVVVYGSNQTGSYEVYAQRYDTTGAAQGSPIVVNDNTSGSQINPTVDADNFGNFVVAWEGNQTEDYDIYADRFSAAGASVPQGTAFPSANSCPTASFTTSQSASPTPGQTRLNIDAGNSSDPDGDDLTFTYEVRDSNNILVASNTTTSSTQSFDLAPGDYSVTVRVSDGDTSCDTSQGADVSTQFITIAGSTFNSSVNAAGYVVPDDGGKKVELSFWGAFDRNGLGGGISLRDPRFGGYKFNSTNITSIVVENRTATITGFGKLTTPEGTSTNVPFTATGFDIYPTFLGRGDRVEVNIGDGAYTLSGYYDRGDVKVTGGTSTTPTAQRR